MVPIIAWMLATGVLAAVVLAVGRARGGLAAAEGVAGGLLFSIGDLSTKVATEGGRAVPVCDHAGDRLHAG